MHHVRSHEAPPTPGRARATLETAGVSQPLRHRQAAGSGPEALTHPANSATLLESVAG